MGYRILPTKEFSKDFKKLDKKFQSMVRDKVGEAALDPTRYKHLHYSLKGSRRLRIGKMRVIFSYNIGKMELYLEKIVFRHKY